jgi:integrase
MRFRRPSGQPAKLTLGSVHVGATKEPDITPTIGGHLTLAGAHRLVAELRHKIAQGRDPAAIHQAEKRRIRTAAVDAAANTFAACAKAFIEQHARVKVRRWKELARLLGLKPEDLTLIPKGLADRWAQRPVFEIDGYDIHAVVDEARRLGVPGAQRRIADGSVESRARKLYAVLSKMFAWLIRDRRVTANPCASVARPEIPEARDRVLSGNEVVQFWKATDATGKIVAPLLKLLLLTGSRLNEVAGMRWTELSDDGAMWEIPGQRTKNHKVHIVPLSPLARDILQNVKRIEGCPYVFSMTGNSPVNGWTKAKNRLDAAMEPAEPWRLHDLRRTAATGMATIGIQPHIVEAVLNHVSGAKAGVAGTYNRAAYLPERKAALERWASHIESLVAGKSTLNVVPLRGTA